jgi:von Willebrand factor type A C-terminal domain
MSKWLLRARELFATTSPASRRHAILLTDGENNEVPGVLDAALQQCRGLFQADCRGVGTDWVVEELRTIASALLGTVDIVREPDEVEAEFEALMEASMDRAAQARLRVRCPRGAAVSFVRQVAPDVEDLTGWGTQIDAHSWEYPLGAWRTEERDYHLSVSVPGNEAGVEMLAARLSLVVPDAVVGPGLVRVVWTDDDNVGTGVSPEVAHYSQQAELSAAIQHGLRALRAGDNETATVRLGQATRLAAASGHDGTVRLLRKVVDVEDERAGTVRIRRHVAKADEMELDTRSTRTVRVHKGDAAGPDTHSARTVRVGAAKEAADPGTGPGTHTGGATP